MPCQSCLEYEAFLSFNWKAAEHVQRRLFFNQWDKVFYIVLKCVKKYGPQTNFLQSHSTHTNFLIFILSLSSDWTIVYTSILWIPGTLNTLSSLCDVDIAIICYTMHCPSPNYCISHSKKEGKKVSLGAGLLIVNVKGLNRHSGVHNWSPHWHCNVQSELNIHCGHH